MVIAERQEEDIAPNGISHKNPYVAPVPAQDSDKFLRQGGCDGKDNNTEQHVGDANGVRDIDGSVREDIAGQADG
ncbi:hypothetical protein FSOLCH5_014715 [Fusarium solani]